MKSFVSEEMCNTPLAEDSEKRYPSVCIIPEGKQRG